MDGSAFIQQLLPITIATEAYQGFKKARASTGNGGGTNGPSDAIAGDLEEAFGCGKANPGTHGRSSLSLNLFGWAIALIVLGVLGLIGAIAITYYCFCCAICLKRRNKRALELALVARDVQCIPAYSQEAYQPLNEPSPPDADEIQIHRQALGLTGGIQPSYSEQQHRRFWGASL